jgi:hypothetical protein
MKDVEWFCDGGAVIISTSSSSLSISPHSRMSIRRNGVESQMEDSVDGAQGSELCSDHSLARLSNTRNARPKGGGEGRGRGCGSCWMEPLCRIGN